MITGLGQEELCQRCDGKSSVNVDDSSGTPEFYRFCKCTGKVPLSAEELALAMHTYELRKQSLVSMRACGGWIAAGH